MRINDEESHVNEEAVIQKASRELGFHRFEGDNQ